MLYKMPNIIIKHSIATVKEKRTFDSYKYQKYKSNSFANVNTFQHLSITKRWLLCSFFYQVASSPPNIPLCCTVLVIFDTSRD